LGNLISKSLRAAGIAVTGPLQRNEPCPANVELALICTPDSEIASVGETIPEGVIIGHCCGAHGTELFASDRRALALHPLMTVTETTDPSGLHGAWAAVDGTDDQATHMAEALARTCGMSPVRIDSDNRPGYHAAASVASNFLITIEDAAEQIAAAAGLPRAALVPLVQASLSNWAELGSAQALTGPVARGDAATVARQREAIAQTNPDLVALFDSLCQATESLAGRGRQE
jgi:predicted short-subunit dehydrogenase-like oxidoreductase (DUF2520 family)